MITSTPNMILRIHADDSKSLDPQYRLQLESVYEALENGKLSSFFLLLHWFYLSSSASVAL
jgi:hypothetical protein